MHRVVAAAVLGERGLLLVAPHAASEPFGLPSGTARPGEPDGDALARVLHGWPGVGVVDGGPLMVLDGGDQDGGPTELVVFRAAADDRVPAVPVAPASPGVPAADAAPAQVWWPHRTALPLAPLLRDAVIPRLRAAGLLHGPGGSRILRVEAMSTALLRAAVLRDGRPIDTIVQPDDTAPDTAFWAAVATDGGYESTVNVRPAAPPWDPDGAGWWQLKGMASAPEARGRGNGAALVAAVNAHVDERGGRLWCNARVPAIGLYARGGYLPVGAPWEHPENGPHQCMARPI